MIRERIERRARTPTISLLRRDVLRPLATKARTPLGNDFSPAPIGCYKVEDGKTGVNDEERKIDKQAADAGSETRGDTSEDDESLTHGRAARWGSGETTGEGIIGPWPAGVYMRYQGPVQSTSAGGMEATANPVCGEVPLFPHPSKKTIHNGTSTYVC